MESRHLLRTRIHATGLGSVLICNRIGKAVHMGVGGGWRKGGFTPSLSLNSKHSPRLLTSPTPISEQPGAKGEKRGRSCGIDPVLLLLPTPPVNMVKCTHTRTQKVDTEYCVIWPST